MENKQLQPLKQLIRGVPWDKLFHNFKNITKDIVSSKILVKYLNTCKIVLRIYNDGIYIHIYAYIYIMHYIYIYILYIYSDVH